MWVVCIYFVCLSVNLHQGIIQTDIKKYSTLTFLTDVALVVTAFWLLDLLLFLINCLAELQRLMILTDHWPMVQPCICCWIIAECPTSPTTVSWWVLSACWCCCLILMLPPFGLDNDLLSSTPQLPAMLYLFLHHLLQLLSYHITSNITRRRERHISFFFEVTNSTLLKLLLVSFLYPGTKTKCQKSMSAVVRNARMELYRNEI